MSVQIAVFYDLATGEVRRYGKMDSPETLVQANEGLVMVDADVLIANRRFVPATQEFIPLPAFNVLNWSTVIVRRNQVLRDCDWAVMPDNELTPPEYQSVVNYRRALRRITTVYDTPEEVVFPDPPAVLSKISQRLMV